MKKEEMLQRLQAYEYANFALEHAMGLLSYDGVTVAPRGSTQARTLSMGELSRMSYALTTSPETVALLEEMMACRDGLDAVTARKVSELYRNYERTRRIPMAEYVAYQKLRSEADAIWHDAKAQNDYASFEPYVQRIFDSNRRLALYIEPDKAPYDTLLDMYERGLDTAMCDDFFATLRRDLVPLIRQVVDHRDRVDDAPLHRPFPVAIQRELSDFVMDLMGIDRDRCIIGETEHPFTSNFSKNDVRITTHYHEDMVASSLYSVVHEGGHALYELHIGDALLYSGLGTGVSMAIHESQSRFYENIIGRGRAFCGLIFPWLKEHFAPRLEGVTEEGFYRMINKSEPSLIRTEADELTYCQHIMVRYELEKRMIDGQLTARELPGEWNRLYQEYLGVDVPSDREGILQDSHWSGGMVGYFPSYALGSAYGAQFLEEMGKTFDVEASVRSGSLDAVNAWFEERIWRHGCMKDPVELFTSVCGPFRPECYTEYLRKKFTEIYGL